MQKIAAQVQCCVKTAKKWVQKCESDLFQNILM